MAFFLTRNVPKLQAVTETVKKSFVKPFKLWKGTVARAVWQKDVINSGDVKGM